MSSITRQLTKIFRQTDRSMDTQTPYLKCIGIEILYRALCPLHISRSDAPIGLRCSRRQIGTKPSDVASGPHSHWPNGAQCVHLRRLVPGSRTILYDSLVYMVKESYLLQLSVALYTFGSRRPPDGLPMRPRQPIPGREPIHIGRANSIGASDRLM